MLLGIVREMELAHLDPAEIELPYGKIVAASRFAGNPL